MPVWRGEMSFGRPRLFTGRYCLHLPSLGGAPFNFGYPSHDITVGVSCSVQAVLLGHHHLGSVAHSQCNAPGVY